MKKANYALSALLLAAAASPALAVDIYKKGAVVSQLRAGQEVLIQTAVTHVVDADNPTPQRYFTGTTVSATPVDSSVYIVEEAPGVTLGGQQAFYFKNKATGKYIAKPKNFASTLFNESFSGLYLTSNESVSEAIAFAAGTLNTTDDKDPFYFRYNKNWLNSSDTTKGTWFDHYYAPLKEDTDNARVVVAANLKFTPLAESVSKLFLSAYWGGSAPVISPYPDTNVSLFYETDGLDGAAMLNAAFKLLPSNVDFETHYPVGSVIGNYSDADAVDALKVAYSEANDALESGSNDEQVEAARALESAVAAVETSKVTLSEGVYRIKGLGRSADAYLYDNYRSKTDSTMKVKGGVSAEEREYDFYYYRVARNAEGKFTIQNVRTGRYLKGSNALYQLGVSSTQPEATFEILPWNNSSDKFSLYSSFMQVQYNGKRCVFHYSGEGNVVAWEPQTASDPNASVWQLEAVDASTLADAKTKTDAYIADIQTRAEAIDSLRMYYNSAVIALDKSRVYNSAAVEDPAVVDDELTFTAWSNAGHNELGGGTDGDGIAALNDNNKDNFFHSLWASGPASQIVGPFHNFYVDFGDGNAKDNFVLKLFRRPTQGNNSPTFIEVYGTNDTTDINNEATWTPVVALGKLFTGAADSAAVTGGISSATPYRFYRFDVVYTVNNAANSGKPFFTLAEINAHSATYNAGVSQYDKIANADALKAAVAAARAQVYGPTSGYTSEVFNTLRTEYKKFIADYAELSEVVAAYNAAMVTYTGSEESATEKPGFFPAGSRDAFKAAIDNARNGVNETSTPEEFKAAVKTINEALANFRAQLYVPRTGVLYKIRSKTNGGAAANVTPLNSYLKAQIDANELTARWDGNDSTNLDSYLAEKVDNRNEYFWRLVPGDGDSLKLQNLGTGLFLKPSAYANSYQMNFDSVGANLVFAYTDKPGTFAFKFGNFYANAQPQTGASGKLVTWYQYGANSIFEVAPAEFDDSYGYAFSLFDLKPINTKHLVTLPYDITGVSTQDEKQLNVYTILGLNETKDKLVLAKVADPSEFKHTAGVPFVVASEDSVFKFQFDKDAINLVSEPGMAVGVQGVFNAKRINQPEYGVLLNDKIVSNQSALIVRTMSAYVTPSVVTTTQAGDSFIEVDGPITNISNAVVINKAVVDVYTVDGKLVKRGVFAATATKALPAGVYVVGGVKVVVK